MVDVAERLINLALYLAAAHGTVTAESIRADVAGYSDDQDEAAFKRMLERDKEFLRTSGFAIACDDEGNYRLDQASTYAGQFELDAAQTASLRAVAVAMAADPSFPFAEELRLALAKLSSSVAAVSVDAVAELADEDAAKQGGLVAELSEAARNRKRVTVSYTNSLGVGGDRELEPYGLFLHAGRWYLVARDSAKSEVRTFAIPRIARAVVNAAKPKQPDFERPVDFAIHNFVRLPFQYGDASAQFDALLLFQPSQAARAGRVTAGHGSTLTREDGSVEWSVTARSTAALARFVIENGPGLSLIGPEPAVAELREGVRRAEAANA